jgi:hypothetical protein
MVARLSYGSFSIPTMPTIILQHDIHGQTMDAMPAALDELTAKGYHLVTVSQLIGMESPKASPTPSSLIKTGAKNNSSR